MLLSFLLVALTTTTLKFHSEARLDSGELFYRELHTENYEGKVLKSAVTTYVSEDGTRMAELKSSYSENLGLPNYTFIDFRSGYEDGVSVEGDQVRIYRKKNKDAERKEKSMTLDSRLVAGQGVNTLVRSRLEELITSKPLHIHLILPSRLDFYQFRIRLLEASDAQVKTRLEIDNWFLRIFASHLDVIYERKTGRLLKYEGISNIEDANGGHPFVRIAYNYDKQP